MDEEIIQKTYGKLVAKAWTDANFKAKLLADTKTVFRDHDIEVPDGLEVCIVEDSKKKKYFILPPGPLNVTAREQLGSSTGSVGPAERCHHMYDYD